MNIDNQNNGFTAFTDCEVLTILPMEVICNPTNASGPDIPDGSITIFITGGTPPDRDWETYYLHR